MSLGQKNRFCSGFKNALGEPRVTNSLVLFFNTYEEYAEIADSFSEIPMHIQML